MVRLALDMSLLKYMTLIHWEQYQLRGTTREARFGNPTPRIAECTSGIINSIGLQNPGIHKVISEELLSLEKYIKIQSSPI